MLELGRVAFCPGSNSSQTTSGQREHSGRLGWLAANRMPCQIKVSFLSQDGLAKACCRLKLQASDRLRASPRAVWSGGTQCWHGKDGQARQGQGSISECGETLMLYDWREKRMRRYPIVPISCQVWGKHPPGHLSGISQDNLCLDM